MKNEKKLLTALILLAVCLYGCSKNSANNDIISSDEDTPTVIIESDNNLEYPKIAYINNISYLKTDEICQAVPRKTPDGIIETFVSAEIMPDAYNSANFGAEQGQLEYMFLEDERLIVHIGDNWFYFEEMK